MKLARTHVLLQSVLAASVGLFATCSFAQSNVTLYGIVDGGVSYVTNAGRVNGKNHAATQFLSGGEAADRFGFKGVEDLGGGFKAIFNLENGFSVANGTLQQGGRLFGRQAYVGLQSAYGTLTFGRQKTVIYDYFFALDPLSYFSWSLATQDAQYANRVDNSVKYFANLGPFSVDALFSTGYDATIANGGQVPGEFRVGQEASLGSSFATGPFLMAVAYDLRRGTSTVTQSDKEQRLVVGAYYQALPALKIFAGYKWFNSSVPATAAHSNMYYGGLQYRFTPAFSMSAATYYTDITTASQHPIDFGINAAYLLSKRTNLYAEVNYVKNSNGSNLGVAGFGTGVVAGANQTGVAIGINHLF
ncbi:porin [Paraburkholderia dipogonis]|uniref:Porin n=1 Tax=Paraburkholderia dipogonis TaxID=1211383 RepID=A0A4Y8MK42_9BURK|nr:porin [Paraburkholderia dipogonis]TFE37799.1 porin [Paraburkholderia dipogonis]